MRRPLLLLLLVALALPSGCLLGDDDPEYEYSLAAIDSVQALPTIAPTVGFRVVAGFPTSCWELVDVQVTQLSTSLYTVALNGRIRNDIGCGDMWWRFERDVTVDVAAPGDYTFRFLRRGGEPLEVIAQVR